MAFNSFSIGLVTRFSISFGELPMYTVAIEMVGTTISGYCSFGIPLNLINPYMEIMIAMIYIAVLLSTAQLVGLNCLNFFVTPSKIFIWKYFIRQLILIPAKDCISNTFSFIIVKQAALINRNCLTIIYCLITFRNDDISTC